MTLRKTSYLLLGAIYIQNLTTCHYAIEYLTRQTFEYEHLINMSTHELFQKFPSWLIALHWEVLRGQWMFSSKCCWTISLAWYVDSSPGSGVWGTWIFPRPLLLEDSITLSSISVAQSVELALEDKNLYPPSGLMLTRCFGNQLFANQIQLSKNYSSANQNNHNLFGL